MPWFSKRNRPPLVPDVVLSQLRALGASTLEARVEGRPIDDPRFGWDNFFSLFLPAYQIDPVEAIVELHVAAGDDLLARFGGSRVVAEFDGSRKDPLYLEMIDGGLQLMYERGLSSGHLTGYEADRWIATHGELRASFDRIEDVVVPDYRATQLYLDLGESLMVAKMGPSEFDNEFYVERIDENSFGAFSMREKESGDGRLIRCEEPEIQSENRVEGVLKALGAHLRRAPYWSHDELKAYFPERRNL